MKEIIYPLGASIDIRQVALGDQTMSVLEIWGAEYQENDCLLIKPDARPLLEAIAARERCIMQVGPSLSKVHGKLPAGLSAEQHAPCVAVQWRVDVRKAGIWLMPDIMRV